MSDWWANDPVAGGEQPMRVTVRPGPAQEGNFWDADPIAEAPREGMDAARDTVQSFAGNALQAIPFVGGALRSGVEHARAGVDSVMNGTSFDDELAEAQNSAKENTENHPIAATAGAVTGGVVGTAPLVAAMPAAFGVAGATLAGRAAAAAGSGALLSGADTAIKTGGDMEAAGDAVLTGGALGAAGPVAGKVIGAGAQALANSAGGRAVSTYIGKAAPTVDALKAQSSALYDQARQIGLTVRPAAFDQFARKLSVDLARAGANSSIHPKTAGYVNEIVGRLGKSQTLDDLDALRHMAGDVAGSPDAAERRLGSIIKDGLDDWMEKLSPLAVESGDKSAVTVIRDARQLWGQARRGEMIDKIARDAKQAEQTVGYEAGLRNGFRAISKNDKALRGFSDIEKRAIRAVAQGTPSERVMRLLGKSAPSGIVSTALSAALGGAVGGPVGALALPAAGHIVKRSADRMTRNAAERAGGLVRMGPVAQRSLPLPRQVNQQSIGQNAASVLLGLAPAINAPRY